MAQSRTPVELAVRALRVRDRTVAEVEARLEADGVDPAEREHALEALARAGYLDDRRVATARAAALAERGSGDALIRLDLERRGVPSELVEDAIAALEPESARVGRILSRRGAGPKTARYLAGKGFDEDVIAAVVARDAGGAIG